MLYIGPLLLGIIIGAGAASGYFLSLPVSRTPFIGAAVTVEVAPQKEAAGTPVETSPEPRLQTVTANSQSALPSGSTELATSAPAPVLAETATDTPTQDAPAIGQQTAALKPAKPAQPAEVTKFTPQEPATLVAPTPEKPTAKDIDTSNSEPKVENPATEFPGLSLGSTTPTSLNEQHEIRPITGSTNTPKISRIDVPTPKPVTTPPAANETKGQEETKTVQPETIVAATSTNPAPQTPVEQATTTETSPPIIKQADLVLPKRNPRLQKIKR